MDESLRAADRDRDQVAESLREHYAQGRLTMEEYDERTTAAVSAKTMGDLRALTADLPGLSAPADPPERAWTPKQMRWIAVGGVVAAVLVLALVTVFGRMVFAVPSWLFILIVVRLLHGRRRLPGGRGPRARRG
jgi:hypothetical protein